MALEFFAPHACLILVLTPSHQDLYCIYVLHIGMGIGGSFHLPYDAKAILANVWRNEPVLFFLYPTQVILLHIEGALPDFNFPLI